MEVFRAVMTVASTLHPAVAVLNAMMNEYQAVQLNRQKLRHLIERCRLVILAIDEELMKQPPTNVDNSIRQLVRHLSFIRDMMSRLAKLGFMKSLMRKEDIARQILDGHQRLTDCLALFQITAAVDVCEYLTALDLAREQDQEALYAQLRVLENNDHEVMRRFDVLGNQVEAMMAIQNSLLRKLDNSPEQRLLKVGLKALQKSSGQKLPIKRPDWSITKFDIEIDPDGELGHGGFGSVKKGKWGKVVVAIKEITGATNYEMLLKEIEVWSQLRHDHILPFYGASAEASPPFIVSRYMANGHIMKYLSTHPNANRVQLVHEIALGMLYIHSKGIVHGDLKAVNVLIDDTTKACIADFGLSRVLQSQPHIDSSASAGTENRIVAGTLRYMSPEALFGDINKTSDVYAFSMTLYEIFTDEPPFMLIPDAELYDHIAKKHERLVHPSDTKVYSRGLTDGMWRLICDASKPIAPARPEFGEITEITERLAEERLDTLREGSVGPVDQSSRRDPAVKLMKADGASPPLIGEEGFDICNDFRQAINELWPRTPAEAPMIPLHRGGKNVGAIAQAVAMPSIPGGASTTGLDGWLQIGPSAYNLVPPMRPKAPGTSNMTQPLLTFATIPSKVQGGLGLPALTLQPPGKTQMEMNRLLLMPTTGTGIPNERALRRQSVIRTIIEKEQRYLQRLEFLDTVFIKAIQHANPPIIPDHEFQDFFKTVFWNISELRETSRRLLKKLTIRQKEQQPNIEIIGDILLEASNDFSRIYPSYIGHLPIARERLKRECEVNTELRLFLLRTSRHTDGRQLDLWQFLTHSSRYIEYYPSELEKLVQDTDYGCVDVDFLYDTGQVIRNISDLARLWTFQYGRRNIPGAPSEWHELVRPDVLGALPKAEIRKQSIIFEVIVSEMEFVADLEMIDELYVQGLRNITPPIFDTQEHLNAFIKQAFWNIAELRNHHQRYLDRLLEVQRQQHPLIDSISSILCESVLDWREAYVKYIPHIPVGAYQIDQMLAQKPAFRGFYQDTLKDPRARRLPMKAFLLQPLSRLPRYNMRLKSILATLPTDHPDVEAIPSVVAVLEELGNVVHLSTEMAQGRVNIWTYSKNLVFNSINAVNMDLMDPARLLIREGALFYQSEGDSFCRKVFVLVLDNFFIITEPQTDHDTTKFHVKERPLPIELLVMGDFSKEGQRCVIMPSGAVRQPGSSNRTSIESDILYPFSVRRAGRSEDVLRFFAKSAVIRSEWGRKLEEAISTRSLAQQTHQIFDMRNLCEDTFSAQLFDDAPVHELSGDVPCLEKVLCSVAFSTSDGRRMVAVGAVDGLWMGPHSETRPLWRVLSLKMVTQCAMLEESGLFLVLADKSLLVYPIESLAPSSIAGQQAATGKPRKLRDGVAFFSVGRLDDRPVVIYVAKKGSDTTLRALEPVARKTDDRTTLEKRKSGSALSRTLSFFGDSRSEWFRPIKEYVLWSDPFDVGFLKTKIAIVSPKAFEIMNLTDLKKVAVPNWKDPQFASLPRRENARPMGVYRASSKEYILCFDSFGVYVDPQGGLSRASAIVEWEGTAERVAFQHPYIVIFNTRFIEVRDIRKGRLLQILSGVDIRCIWDGRSTSVTQPATPGTSGTIDSTVSNYSTGIHGVMKVAGSGDKEGVYSKQKVFELLPTQRMQDRNETSTGQGSSTSPASAIPAFHHLAGGTSDLRRQASGATSSHGHGRRL
ncbi:hypothetical protein FRB94_010320 [Tulasnella sp. JGI-2019a]|nr:hypothetical protein FRB93_008875 [Tulasnella sp. JGI-2019a]KAG8993871.1 hypothetical protein FRB94_010320 [Tulasnella sp. JGI-2019a]